MKWAVAVAWAVFALFDSTGRAQTIEPVAPLAWVFETELTGAMNQRLAVAHRIAALTRVLPALPPREAAVNAEEFAQSILGASFSDGSAWPDFIVHTEKRAHETDLLLGLKRISPKPIRIVHLENPERRIDEFDLVVNGIQLPPIAGTNVFRPIGVASWATPFELDRARAEWRERLEWLAPSRPWTVVAIGGNQHENPYLIAYARDLAVRLRRLHERIGGTLLLATSRRTPEDAISKLDQALRGIPYRVADWRGPERNNFYRGALAMADRVIATGDSLSMMSDALAAGKPLFVHAPAGSTRPEHDRMIHALFVRGLARPFTGADEAFAAPPAFNVADQIATEVQRRFSRGSCRAFFRRP